MAIKSDTPIESDTRSKSEPQVESENTTDYVHRPTLPPIEPLAPEGGLSDQVDGFLERFPGGFAGPTYRASWGERARGRQRLPSSLRLATQLTEVQSTSRAAEVFIELLGSTKLVPRAQHRAAAAVTGSGRERLGAAVIALVQGMGGPHRRFRHWLVALDRLNLPLGWLGTTAPLAFTDPQRHMLVRRETARLQAPLVYPCAIPTRPTPQAYREARRIGGRTREELIAAGLHPTSLLDVHVFIEHVHRASLRPSRQLGQRSADGYRRF